MSKLNNFKIMSKLFFAFLLVSILCNSEQPVYADEAEVIQNINKVEENIEKAFLLIEGVNIPTDSTIINDLNLIIDILYDAKWSLTSMDYDQALSESEEALTMSENVLTNTRDLTTKMLNDEKASLRNQDITSGAFILFAVLAGVISWRFVERSYYKDLLKKRPELV